MKTIVLIVEDQADIRKLVQMTLDFGEFEVHEAENGQGALRMLEAVRPHIVLLDVMMPGDLDGYQVCRQIKSNPNWVGTRVVMLTARGQQSDYEAGRLAGADKYLTKPFSPIELIEVVEGLADALSSATN